MKQYKSLDFAKFVCAILIIILHTEPFSSYSGVLTFGFRNIITVVAVPFFFLTSGFLTFKKLDTLNPEEKMGYIARNLKRIAIMYLIWSAVYFVFVVIKWTKTEFSYVHVLEYIRDFFFEGSYSTIWFLPALFSATLILYLLHRKISYRNIFIIACIIYVFTLGGSSYFGLVTKIPAIEWVYNIYYTFFDTIKNGVCFGLIFVTMGAMFSESEERIVENSKAVYEAVLTGFFAVLLAVEEFVVAYFNWNVRGVDTVVMLIPFTFFFVRFLLCFDLKISDQVCVKMRKYSILMFLTQRIPMSILELFFGETVFVQNSILYFVTVFSVTMLISFLILQASKKFVWIKYAY